VRVSLILTVKNESDALDRLMDSIAAQSRPPDEIIVADGGSTDGTLDRLHALAARLPLQVLSLPGANISQGRNAAIRAASHDLICSTDAGVRLDQNWVAELAKPFEGGRAAADLESVSSSLRLSSSGVDVVSGFFLPDAHGIFETALAATTLPALAEIRPKKFMPSSRSIAFRKSAWQAVNGYPEWLDYCEDLIFDFALREKFQFAFAPAAIAYFRPRESLRAFFKQYYLYARGDGKANLWLRRHLIRYATYLVALPVCIAVLFSSSWILGLGLMAFGAGAMFFTPCKRLAPMIRDFTFSARARTIAWVPVIRVTGDIAKMLGYPIGIIWRMRNHS
jgi:glycosyltransferase involved in cell wall biosynthesis